MRKAGLGLPGILLLFVGADGCAPRRQIPTTLRITGSPAPPFTERGADGAVCGLAVDVLDEAARRNGIKLEWSINRKSLEDALRHNEADLVAVTRTDSVWRTELYATRPWLRNGFFLLTAGEGPADPSETLEGKSLAIVAGALTKDRAARFYPKAQVKLYPSRLTAAEAFCRDEADAALVEMRLLQSVLLNRPNDCRQTPFRILRVRKSEIELGIGAAYANRAVADLLRDEIDQLRREGFIDRKLDKWAPLLSNEAELLLEEQERRASMRIRTTLWAAAGVIALLLLWSLWRISAAKRMVEKASLAKSEFLAHISHEIRTPLAGMVGTAELLSTGQLNGTQAEYVKTIRESGVSLLTLLNDILDIKRIEAGKLEIVAAPFDLPKNLEQTIETFRGPAETKGLHLSAYGLSELPPRALGDALRIRQVVSNLLSNAIKFTATGSVRVRTRWEEPPEGQTTLLLEVEDTGVGVPPEAAAQIFERFEQASSTVAASYGGTGLGLSVSRRLIQLMGGEMGVRAQDGGGSVFWLRVPLTVPDEGGESRTRNALLVEDDAVNRLVAAKLLERAGCEVAIATTGTEALERFAARRFDIVFLDCHLPDMDGYRVTGLMRKKENGANRTPIVALTAASVAGEREKAMAAGMDDFLTKPLDIESLERTLARWAG